MTQSSKQPNPKLTEAKELIEKTIAGGPEAPDNFAQLINLQLQLTIAKNTQFVAVQRGPNPKRFSIAPHRRPQPQMLKASAGAEIYGPIQLNNGNFLVLEYDVFLDKKTEDGETTEYMKIIRSKIGYQLDELGEKELWRYDYARFPKTEYVFSHLHVYGEWLHSADGLKHMPKVHFPVVRTSLEGCLRTLLDDFEIESRQPAEIYLPILDYCEERFLKVARKSRKLVKDYPGE